MARVIAINPLSPTLGCDPEFFLSRNGSIIPSSQVIPEEGLTFAGSRFVRDGVQAEFQYGVRQGTLNLIQTCRGNTGNYIASAFNMFRAWLREKHPDVTCDWTQVVTLTDEQMAALSPDERRLGCSPSLNVYDPSATPGVEGDYPVRSAGGHLHFGLVGKPFEANAERLVMALDCSIGLLSVLIDRDPRAAERRRVYGRAGEYRLQKHGIEYRTLSNHWMRGYPLFSLYTSIGRAAMAAGLGRYKFDAVNGSKWVDEGHWEDFISRFDLGLVQKAINESDFDIAKAQLEGFKAWTHEVCGNGSLGHLGITIGADKTSWQMFDYFVEQGLDSWFEGNALDHWADLPEGHTCGWENFLMNRVWQRYRTLNRQEKTA